MSSLPLARRRLLHVSASAATKSSTKKSRAETHKWFLRQSRDPFVKEALHCGYRSRSAFKLLQVDERFGIFKAGMTVVDCGAAPGSWSQVAVERVRPGGRVIAVDRDSTEPIGGVCVLNGADLDDERTRDALAAALLPAGADVWLSDMAPNTTGNPSLDHERIVMLAERTLRFALDGRLLKLGGTVLCKLWNGADEPAFVDFVRSRFKRVKRIKPDASRAESAEIFILGRDLI